MSTQKTRFILTSIGGASSIRSPNLTKSDQTCIFACVPMEKRFRIFLDSKASKSQNYSWETFNTF